MACDNCDQVDTVIDIHGPDQLTRICQKILVTVKTGTLSYDGPAHDQNLHPFMDLDFSHLPDILNYQFCCPRCKNHYILFADTYHGGGKWSRTQKDPGFFRSFSKLFKS
jgi:hypothetical protein